MKEPSNDTGIEEIVYNCLTGGDSTSSSSASSIVEELHVRKTPSHLETTTLAKQLPRTLTDALAMSMIWSTPKMRVMTAGFKLNWSHVAAKTTRDDRGTPINKRVVRVVRL